MRRLCNVNIETVGAWYNGRAGFCLQLSKLPTSVDRRGGHPWLVFVRTYLCLRVSSPAVIIMHGVDERQTISYGDAKTTWQASRTCSLCDQNQTAGHGSQRRSRILTPLLD